MTDLVYLNDSRARVTSKKVIVADVAYPLADIQNAQVFQIPPRRLGPVLLFGCGLFLLFIPSVLAVLWMLGQRSGIGLLLKFRDREIVALRFRHPRPEDFHLVLQTLQAIARARDSGKGGVPAPNEPPLLAGVRACKWRAERSSARWAAVFSSCLLLLLGSFAWHFAQPRRYQTVGYKTDFSTNGVEVGTVLRFPLGLMVPAGRYAAVVAFPIGTPEEFRLLYVSPLVELPDRPKFDRFDAGYVVYQLRQGGEVRIDLSKWRNFPTEGPREAPRREPLPPSAPLR